ncbi:NAD(P)-dependent alcohol dehydrogenase [Balamuthia mandrillaris]
MDESDFRDEEVDATTPQDQNEARTSPSAAASSSSSSTSPFESPKEMRAVVFRRFGEPGDVLELIDDQPVPEPAKGEVLVHVFASSINPVDWKFVMGLLGWFAPSPPYIPGSDVSGVVVKVGPGCTKFKAGDQVWGATGHDFAAFSDFITIPESHISKKPHNQPHMAAATMPLVCLTAYQALQKARLSSGQKLLVLGGSGGVGSAAVQLGKQMGAYVAATCSSNNEDFVRSLGADHVVDYTTEDWSKVLSGQNFDVLLDTVGEANTWHRAHTVLKKSKGVFATVVPTSASNLNFSNNSQQQEQQQQQQKHHLMGVTTVLKEAGNFTKKKFWQAMGYLCYQPIVVRPSGKDLERLAEIVESGALRPVVSKSYPMEQVRVAFEESKAGHVRGKLALVFQEEDTPSPYSLGDDETEAEPASSPLRA